MNFRDNLRQIDHTRGKGESLLVQPGEENCLQGFYRLNGRRCEWVSRSRTVSENMKKTESII